jgi:hypothetical protein
MAAVRTEARHTNQPAAMDAAPEERTLLDLDAARETRRRQNPGTVELTWPELEQLAAVQEREGPEALSPEQDEQLRGATRGIVAAATRGAAPIVARVLAPLAAYARRAQTARQPYVRPAPRPRSVRARRSTRASGRARSRSPGSREPDAEPPLAPALAGAAACLGVVRR